MLNRSAQLCNRLHNVSKFSTHGLRTLNGLYTPAMDAKNATKDVECQKVFGSYVSKRHFAWQYGDIWKTGINANYPHPRDEYAGQNTKGATVVVPVDYTHVLQTLEDETNPNLPALRNKYLSVKEIDEKALAVDDVDKRLASYVWEIRHKCRVFGNRAKHEKGTMKRQREIRASQRQQKKNKLRAVMRKCADDYMATREHAMRLRAARVEQKEKQIADTLAHRLPDTNVSPFVKAGVNMYQNRF